MIKNDIPIEGVLKYIKKERDNYKDKLETLIPYTKSLELKLKEQLIVIGNLHDEINRLNAELEANKVTKAEIGEAKHLVKENALLRAELKAMKEDYKQSDWYKTLQRHRKQLRDKQGDLIKAYNKVLLSKGYPEELCIKIEE